MATKRERSEAASILGKAGSKAFLEKYDIKTRRQWAKRGGQARAENHTPRELQAFAANAGRKPYKITPTVRRQILAMIDKGCRHREIAERFDISLRAIGRLVAEEKR